MSNPEISVIVPVYNVEKYLQRCVDSILEQTFENIEILLVDDGSTDGSGAICDQYALKDSRIHVIHKKNGGLSDARNAGMDVSVGNYLSFVDSDDFIAPNMLQTLHDLAVKQQADISICGMCECFENSVPEQNPQIICQTYTGIEALRQAFIGNYFGMSICTKMVRRDLCKDHRFIKGKTSEDVFFTPQLLLRAQRVAFTSEPLYNYWHRGGSITTRPFSPAAMDVIEGYEIDLRLVDQVCPELHDVAVFRLYWAYFVAFDRIVIVENFKKIPQYVQVKDYLKKNWLNIVRCPYFRRSRRIAALALKVHVSLYRKLVLMRDKANEVHD